MGARFIDSIRLDGFLSFAPDSPAFELQSLNVLIGANGSGKSNFIEAFELLKATPTDFARAIRDGGGAAEWLWKGKGNEAASAGIDAILKPRPDSNHGPLRHRLSFAAPMGRVEVVDEAIENQDPQPGKPEPYFYYRFQQGKPVLNYSGLAGQGGQRRELRREDLKPDQSVLAQRQDPVSFPEITWLSRRYGEILTFREWTFGRYAPVRRPQGIGQLSNRLSEDSSNLALVLGDHDAYDRPAFMEIARRFLPGLNDISVSLNSGGAELVFYHGDFGSKIPATRISDGTLRFLALLAILLARNPPPLICIEEPELGLHPDALARVGDLLIDASRRAQLIVTTHSDALISALTSQVDAVITCENFGKGTELRRLEPGRLQHWLENYTLGDVWRMGDIGANP